MKIDETRWMLAGESRRGKPFLHTGYIGMTRQHLIRQTTLCFYGGKPWAYIRKQGWRAVKIKITGQLS